MTFFLVVLWEIRIFSGIAPVLGFECHEFGVTVQLLWRCLVLSAITDQKLEFADLPGILAAKTGFGVGWMVFWRYDLRLGLRTNS